MQEIAALIVVFIGMSLMLRSMWLAAGGGDWPLGVGIGWTFGWATALSKVSSIFSRWFF